MEVKLQKWGNSSGIRIPSNVLKDLNLKNDDLIELTKVNQQLVMKKIKKKKLTFDERIANCPNKGIVESFDWGKPKGKEIW